MSAPSLKTTVVASASGLTWEQKGGVGRILAKSGDIEVGAVFPDHSSTRAGWSFWLGSITGAHKRARTVDAAKAALESRWREFLSAARLEVASALVPAPAVPDATDILRGRIAEIICLETGADENSKGLAQAVERILAAIGADTPANSAVQEALDQIEAACGRLELVWQNILVSSHPGNPTVGLMKEAIFTIRKYAAAAIGAGGQAVQDTWFTDRALPVMAISGDVEDNRVLRLHFRRQVTDDDRKAMCDALNLHQASLSQPHPADERVVEALRIAKERLSSLLARIHRDGGHYEAEHGTVKAWTDADEIIARIYADDTHPAHSPAAIAQEGRS